VTDDPWRKPDPPQSVPPPQPPYPQYPQYPGAAPYGPPNAYPAQYDPPPYGQYNPNNPYQAPLPKRGGIGRLLWILCTAGILVLGGCGVGIYFLAHSLTKNADEVNAFLRNVRDQQFSAAYQHLCPSVGTSETALVTALQSAASRGHEVTSFDITSSNTSKVSGAGTLRSAAGEVTFADHTTREVAFTLDKPSGHLCISSGFTSLD
jgi:hypothetical protein